MRPEEREPRQMTETPPGGRLFASRSVWVVALVMFAVGVVAGAVWLALTTEPPRPAKREALTPGPSKTTEPQPEALGPRVAIVIDDLGGDLEDVRALLELPQPLTFAVLPKLAYSRETAEAASRAGKDVLLHLPMEPMDYPAKNPGPGALLRSMSAEAMKAVLAEDLEDVPHSIGVNNHMGSRLTEDEEVMHLVLSFLKERNLFFLDSYTTPRSVVESVARRLELPTASRHVFLDHVANDPDYVAGQLGRLVATAKRHNAAIGIGHPRPATIAALKSHLPKLAEEGVKVVPLSHLVAAH